MRNRPTLTACVLLLLLAPAGRAQPTAAGKQDHAATAALIRQRLDPEVPDLVALYKHFHAHPELALHEARTAARLAQELRKAGLAVTEKVGGHGVVGVLANGPGPTILVRADMDGLPIVEQTGLPYASKERTRDADGQEVGVMHACGHDMNLACLVGTARTLTALKDRWRGTLVFIGQPAEEIGAGARAMLADGLLTRFPRPDFGLGLHCDGRFPHGHVNYRAGRLQANVDSVDILVRGTGGHGAAPHATVDPIVLAARLVLDLQTLVSRERDPAEPVVVTVGSFHGGTKHNIIPAEVKLQLTVRTTTDAARKDVLEGITRLVTAAARGARAPGPVVRHDPAAFTPALYNEPELTARFVGLFRDVLGPDRVHERPVSMGGEDFSQFTRAGIRTFYYHLGTVPPEQFAAAQKPGGPPLPPTHSPFFAPVPEPTLRTGVLTMALAVLDLAAPAAAPAKPGPAPVELVGRATDFFFTKNYNSYYWREDFSFLLKDEKTGKTWRVISREPTPAYTWRMGTTFPGLKVDWAAGPRVKVVGVTGVDRQPAEFYRFKLDEPNVATAFVVWAETAADRWQEYYVNNWFHKWGDAVDPVVHTLYADRPAPYDVYGYVNAQHAPFSKAARALLAQHPKARMFHGLVRRTRENERGYEIEPLHLVGPDPQGNGVVYHGDPATLPRLETKK